MTIQDAIRSGKPFKRQSWDTWVQPAYNAVFHKVPKVVRSGSYSSKLKFATKEDIMANDWIVQDRFKEDLLEAVQSVLTKHDMTKNRMHFYSSPRYPGRFCVTIAPPRVVKYKGRRR